MAIHKEFSVFANQNKPYGFFINLTMSLFAALSIFIFTNDMSFIRRAILSYLLILLNLCEIPKSLNFIQNVYWKIIIPGLGIIGYFWSNALLFSIIQVYAYFHMMEAIPQIFSYGETLMNSYVLTTIFQFALTSEDLKSKIIYYPVF